MLALFDTQSKGDAVMASYRLTMAERERMPSSRATGTSGETRRMARGFFADEPRLCVPGELVAEIFRETPTDADRRAHLTPIVCATSLDVRDGGQVVDCRCARMSSGGFCNGSCHRVKTRTGGASGS